MEKKRVVITGMGAISCVGNDVAAMWDSLVNGRCGIGTVTRFDATNYKTQVAGEVKVFEPHKYLDPKEARRFDDYFLYAIAAAAEAYYIPFAPHNPSGPVANAATLQLAACCPNFSILEIMYSDVEWRADVTDEALVYQDGYITIPDRPGLGIEINEEECLKHPYTPHTLRHYTGALTDIRPAKTKFYF